jgi:hypothetical protein
MLVSKVCLGNIKQEKSSVKRDRAPDGYHSVEGVPGGRLKYSEFVIYDNDQVLENSKLYVRIVVPLKVTKYSFQA